MIVERSREYTVNMGDRSFESLKFGARVTVDSAELPEGADIFEKAGELLEIALAPDLREAREVTEKRDSFILTWGTK